MQTTTWGPEASRIIDRVSEICGCAWDDYAKPQIDRGALLSEVIASLANMRDMGTDGDLTHADRVELRRLAAEMREVEAGLTAAQIREVDSAIFRALDDADSDVIGAPAHAPIIDQVARRCGVHRERVAVRFRAITSP